MNILILGASSAIAEATAHQFARQGHNLFLASRNEAALERTATDLRIRYSIKVECGFFDAEKIETHALFWNTVLAQMTSVDGVLLAFGYLGDEPSSYATSDTIKRINVNLTGAVSVLSQCIPYFTEKKAGFIIGISSVAGDRGRQSNSIYGAAKAGFSAYLQGLRQYFYTYGVRVITIKPGFVITPMTRHFSKMLFPVSADYAGRKIAHSLNYSADIVYLPWFWRYIMLIIKLIPEKIFKRLRF